jgi:hypothetical protein
MSQKIRRKMESQQVFIPISQLATYINLNPYGNLSDILTGLWMKIDLNGYSKKLLELEQKTGQSFKALSEWETMIELCNHFGLDLKDQIKESMKSECNADLKSSQRALLNQVNNIPVQNNNDAPRKEKLSSLITSFTNRGYGTNHENSAIDLYQDQTGYKVTDQQKKVTKKLITSQHPPVEWHLTGKLDGLAIENNGEQIIVEIKNRTTKLFGHLKDYEKPQIQSYLKLMGLTHGHLVESLQVDKGKSPYARKREIKIIPVKYEPEYWNQLKNRFAGFVNFFGNFIQNDQLQELVLCGPDQHGEQLLKNILETHISDAIV